MKLIQKIAALFAAVCMTASVAHASDNKIVVDGSTTVGPIAKAFAEYYMTLHPDVNITVSESGSGNGAKGIINGACDVGAMSRFMKESEIKAAADKGVLPVPFTVAMDGLAVIVHPSNPISGLTTDQVRDVYTGKITNWKELGGQDAKIVVISRDTNSGTYETFYELVMTHSGTKEKIGQSAEYAGSNGAVRARVQSTPGAIGYAGLGFVDRQVKALTINGVYPDTDTVSSGRYPIARALFMFSNGYPKLGTDLFNYLNLYLTPKGQEIIEAIGFVPVTKY